MGKLKNKRVGVLFSGGLDSTYLVWKNLRDGNTVVPIYIEITNNEIKTILEKNRTKIIHKDLATEFNADKSYSDSPLKDIHDIATVGVCANEDSLYFKQVPVWIIGVLFSQGLEVDEIQIGYVGNDDAIPYLQDIQKIYKSYQAMSEKLIPLTFPLFKTRKWEMAKDLPHTYMKNIVSCENPRIIGSEEAEFVEYEPCCECTPCRTIIASDYYYMREFPDYYQKKINEKYIRKLRQSGYKVLDKEGNDVDGWGSEKCVPEPHQLSIEFDRIETDSVDLRGKAECIEERDEVPELN